MTPEARYAAAVDVLDDVQAGRPAEQVLTNWTRRNRYAGSGDRAAIRDIVFDCLRRKRSAASLGGGQTGRALVLGVLRDQGVDPDSVFTSGRYALAELSAEERAGGRTPEGNEALDVPDWIAPLLKESLGETFEPVCRVMRQRAELFLRWHARRTDEVGAIEALARDGVVAEPHALAPQALRVLEGARRVRLSAAYRDGLVEIQDAASQAVCAGLEIGPGVRVLDYCAGGGGKALAMAAQGARVWAHDVDPGRMADLPVRAERAKDDISRIARQEISTHAPFDLVVVDAPCSGSGAWRRQVEAKWSLTAARLDELVALQAEIVDEAVAYVKPGGRLVYATCSMLNVENTHQIDAFLLRSGSSREDDWRLIRTQQYTPLDGGDGFFLAEILRGEQPGGE